MSDPTLETVFYSSIERIQKLEATQADLALVFIMSEFIDSLGGSQEMAKLVDQLERKWQRGLEEYARGEV